MPKEVNNIERVDLSNGEYSVAYFYDSDRIPCSKDDAKFVNIVIYNSKNERINEVYGVI